MTGWQGSVSDAEFNLSAHARTALLGEAKAIVGAGGVRLGSKKHLEAAADPTTRILDEIDHEMAHFSPELEVLELLEQHFTQHGLPVPTRFKDESRDNRFFWVRFPVMLRPANQKPFVRLKCALEFNPGNGARRPTAKLILPDRKFLTLAEAHTGLTLAIDESFNFGVALPSMGIKPPKPPDVVKPPTPSPSPVPSPAPAPAPADPGVSPGHIPVPLPGSPVTISGSAAADVKAVANLGVVAGPFKNTIKKTKLNHAAPGSPEVFWEFTDTEYLREEDPNLVVVLQVPNDVPHVEIAGALKADDGFDFLSADLGDLFGLLTDKIKEFFRGSAPITDRRTWNITDRTIKARPVGGG